MPQPLSSFLRPALIGLTLPLLALPAVLDPAGMGALFSAPFGLCMVGVIIVLPMSVVGLMRPSKRALASKWFVGSLCWLGMFVPVRFVAVRAHRSEMRAVSERYAPLVAAIEAFEEQEGHPPATLASLVPARLAELPDAGPAPLPLYEFILGGPGLEVGRASGGASTWRLEVRRPSLFFLSDYFMYQPERGRTARATGDPAGGWHFLGD
jgi:hypothetical protein